MALFPQNPANNQQMTVNGITYVYNSSLTAWVRFATFLGNVTANNGTFYDNVAVTNNITSAGNMSASGNITGQYIIGNGSQLTGIVSTVAQTVTNAAQPNITSVGTLTSLSVSGNANVGNIGATNGVFTNLSGNGSSLTSITGANVTGTVANATYATSAGSATTAGTVTTAAQPNITSTGTLTTLSVSGNSNVGNLGATGVFATTLSATGNGSFGNVSATLGEFTNVSGNGSLLTSITGANVTGQVGNALVAGTVYTNAQPNITSVGTLTAVSVSGNANVGNVNTGLIATTGNVTIGAGSGGNITGANLVSANFFTGTLTTAAQPNITSTGTLTTLSVSGNANIGNIGTAGLITATGNITGNFFIGNGSQLTGVAAGTATTAQTVTTNAQPNITSVGTLTSLSVSGNITGGNLIGVFANGNSNISIPAANGNINISAGGTPNEIVITSTGINVAGTLSATGNANVDNIGATNGVFTNVSGNGALLTALNGSNLTTGTVALARLPTLANTTDITQGQLIRSGDWGFAATAFAGSGTDFTANVYNYSQIFRVLSSTVTGPGISGGGVVMPHDGTPTTTYVVAGAGSDAGRLFTGYKSTANATPTWYEFLRTSSTGNANIGNLGVTGLITATGNIGGGNLNTTGIVSSSRLISTVTTGTAPFTVTSTTQVANLNVATAGTAGTVTTNAQPNITSVGTLSSLSVSGTSTLAAVNGTDASFSGNATVNGNLFVNGNLTYLNVETVAVEDPIIQLQTGANGAAPIANSGKDVGTALNYYDGAAKIAFMGWDVSNAEIAFGSNVSITNEVVTFTSLANTRSGNTLTTGVFATTLSATGNANIANIGTAGLITAEGTVRGGSLSTGGSLGVTGNANIGNIGTTGLITATGNIGGGNLNTTGIVSSSRLISTVATGTAPLTVTSTTRISNLNVAYSNVADFIGTGVASSGNFNITLQSGTSGNIQPLGNIAFIANASNGALYATTFVGALSGAATSATTAGTVTTAAQPNITSVGTLTSLSVTGNITGGNLIGVFANGNSNIAIPAAGGNINFSIGGSASEVVFTSTGANVNGYLSASGNAIIAGSLGLGTSTLTGYGIHNGLTLSGAATVYADRADGAIANTVTGAAVYFATSASTAAAAAAQSLTGLIHYQAVQGSFGTNAAVTTQSGFVADNTLTGATNNYGFRGSIASGANRFNLYMDGTANNYSAGNFGIGTTSPAVALHVRQNGGTINVEGTDQTYIQFYPRGMATRTAYVGVGSAGSNNFTIRNDDNGQLQLQSGNSNVAVFASANVTTSVAGNANIVVVTGTGANVNGYLSVSGNANIANIGTAGLITATGNIGGGNLVTTGIVSASRLVSTVATGTAPFTVTSTTQVANLNVATAGTAGTVTTAAQGNITSVGTLTTVSVSGNANIANINLNAGGFLLQSVQAAITAAGNVQGTATALSNSINIVSTVSVGQGVRLPTAITGMGVKIINLSANSLAVYPATSGVINALAVNAAFTLGANSRLEFVASNATQWYTMTGVYA
jgi:hypothetical protein